MYTHDLTDRFVSLIQHPDRNQFTGLMQLGQIDRIAPVGHRADA